MPRVKKRAGIGATTSVPTRFLHPTRIVKTQVPGVAIPANHVTVSLTIVRMEAKLVRRAMQQCYILHHPSYQESDGSPIELHTVCRHCKILEEGPADGIFVVVPPAVEADEEMAPVPVEVLNFRVGDDPNIVARAGIQVDDDNQPAPENAEQVPVDNGIYQPWGFQGFCPRRTLGHTKHAAQLLQHTGAFDHQSMWEHLFPTIWVRTVLLPATNKELNDDNQLTYGEFLRWLGLWFVMATTEGCQRRDFWSTTPISMYEGAPFRFNDLGISRNRFEEILGALTFTDQAIDINDRFTYVRQMVDCWNTNMTTKFRPSYISCLDESMSPWTSPFTCPGYMFVPRKPHPFGNEYHSVACGLSSVMWGIELVEGKMPHHTDQKNTTTGEEQPSGFYSACWNPCSTQGSASCWTPVSVYSRLWLSCGNTESLQRRL
jgi:Transposase IS4